jgi:YD repeat-containing protein
MKKITWIVLAAVVVTVSVQAGTIIYSYDEQHRLAGVNYDNQATVTYGYDKANNLIQFNVLTDAQYQQPFMLWLSDVDQDWPSSLCRRNAVRPGVNSDT